ncbi:MAG: acyl-CoA thioesterase [Desulfobacterales bacterium]|nr:acyl-CoA thioesterase [Desulfobacterales bacterium]MDJ0884304.1 acyl-CoA thioesterase [Desulfobacterales bacterium]
MQGKSPDQSSSILTHFLLPEDANPSGNVHGGVIMKHIDSAGGVAAFRHARRNVVTASIDRLDFIHPAFVGDLLILKARVNLTGRTSMEVGVRAETEDLPSGTIRHVASAFLTFVALDADGKPAPIPPLEISGPDEEKRHRMALARREARLAEKQREAACDADPANCGP